MQFISIIPYPPPHPEFFLCFLKILPSCHVSSVFFIFFPYPFPSPIRRSKKKQTYTENVAYWIYMMKTGWHLVGSWNHLSFRELVQLDFGLVSGSSFFSLSNNPFPIPTPRSKERKKNESELIVKSLLIVDKG